MQNVIVPGTVLWFIRVDGVVRIIRSGIFEERPNHKRRMLIVCCENQYKKKQKKPRDCARRAEERCLVVRWVSRGALVGLHFDEQVSKHDLVSIAATHNERRTPPVPPPAPFFTHSPLPARPAPFALFRFPFASSAIVPPSSHHLAASALPLSQEIWLMSEGVQSVKGGEKTRPLSINATTF